jgi:hypothetical protein
MVSILECLKAGEEDMDLLAIEMRALQKIAKLCGKESHEIYEQYDTWGWFVQELYEAALGSQADTAVRLETVSSSHAAAEALEKERQENVANANKLMKRMESELKDAKDSYNKSIDDMPTG